MKKKLEAELMSLAHKVLKLKNRDDIHVLRQEAGKLYEKLAVLAFIEDNSSVLNPTFTLGETQEKVIEIFEKSEEKIIDPIIEILEPVVEVIEEKKEEVSDEIIEEIQEINEEVVEVIQKVTEVEVIEEVIDLIPQKEIELNIDFNFPKKEVEDIISKEAETPKSTLSKQSSIDQFLEEIAPMPTFVKATSVFEIETSIPIEKEDSASNDSKSVTINDKLKKSLSIGLNDKIAFVKHLFDGNNADFIRVVSQVNTLNTFEEAKDFIEFLVKPDHNNWIGKEEVEERFMHLIENKFS